MTSITGYSNGQFSWIDLITPDLRASRNFYSELFDWDMVDGVAGIPIEERDAAEVTHVSGRAATGEMLTVQITPDGVSARNFAFDVTPARLVTGLITERGICPASEAGLESLFPEHRAGEHKTGTA